MKELQGGYSKRYLTLFQQGFKSDKDIFYLNFFLFRWTTFLKHELCNIGESKEKEKEGKGMIHDIISTLQTVKTGTQVSNILIKTISILESISF